MKTGKQQPKVKLSDSEWHTVPVQQIAERRKSALVQDLLINNIKSEAEIHNRAALYGWDLHSGGVAVIVDINNIKRSYKCEECTETRKMLDDMTDKIFHAAREEMSELYKSAYYMRLSDLLIYIVTLKAEERARFRENMQFLFERIQTRIKELPFTVILGIGTYYDNIADIHNSYKEARSAIDMGYAFDWYDRVLCYNEILLYRLLKPVMDSDDATQCCEQLFKPLHDYDRNSNRDLFETLRQIFNCNWNLTAAAEVMHLHPNSMKYRYEKICRLLNMDLKQRDNRLMVGIAVMSGIMRKNINNL